jgi:hypothetical protein
MDPIATDNRLTFGEIRIAMFRTKHGLTFLFGLFFGGIPLIMAPFVAIGGVLIVFGLRGLRRKLKLLFGKGMATLGKNLGIQFDYSTQVNNQPCPYLQFEFVDLQGNKHNCRNSYRNEKQIQLLKDKIEVPIVYLPDIPDAADLDFEKIDELQLND